MKQDIKKIIESAVNAPSGGNSQPWKFKVKENQIYVIAIPENDHPILNYRNRGTLIANGALIENIVIVASSFGYYSKVTTFPNESDYNLTAIIELSGGLVKSDPLFLAVPLRTTNRKKYHNIALNEHQKQELINSESMYGVKILFLQDQEQRLLVGHALSVNEIVTLENKQLHALFFKEITWSESKALERKSGFYLKTMELKPPQQLMIKLLSNWNVMKLFNIIKFARVIAKDNAKVYASGAGIIAITISDNDKEFLSLGRAMQRLWLKATLMGLSAHPITGTLFFWQAIENNSTNVFSKEHKEMIRGAYRNIQKIFNVNSDIVAFLLRIGFSDQPSALTVKKAPDITWI